MSAFIIVGFDRKTNTSVTQSYLTQKIIRDICTHNTEELCHWLRHDFGFFNEDRYKDQIEEMYNLLSATVPTMVLDTDKTTWLKEYWIIDCLYSALNKCFPQLNLAEITQYQERWFDAIYSGRSEWDELHPTLGTKGHAIILCPSCESNTVPFKVLVNLPELPLPKTPNYCPQCYEKDQVLYYLNLSGKPVQYRYFAKVHKL